MMFESTTETNMTLFNWIILVLNEKDPSQAILAQGVSSSEQLAKDAVTRTYAEVYDSDDEMVPDLTYARVAHHLVAEDPGMGQAVRITEVTLDA